jgi:UDP-3-O-[3-hydroxymyristoyl] glucosamine N-acyltransferase
VVAPSARVGEGAHIGPYCFVDEDVTLGRNAVLHSFVSIYRGARIGQHFFAHSHSVVREFCQVGSRVILQNGAVVGGDGFGFARKSDGSWYKMQQAGIAIIEDDVEIQANTTVDRATIGRTVIRRGAKLDNLVLVGHASEVGEDTLLCGQVGLAGSTVVGKNCILAGQSASAGHLEIGDGAVLTAQSAVHNDMPPRATYSGSPALENKVWLKCVAAYNRLPELQKTVRELRAEVEQLKSAS